MGRVHNVSMEPDMEELLASIRRAIDEEGIDLHDRHPADREARMAAAPTALPALEAARRFDDLPQPLAARRGPVEFPTQRPGDRHVADRKHAASSEILALRGRIGKVVHGEPDPRVEPFLPEAAAPNGAHFRGILSGREERGPRRGDVPLRPAANVPRAAATANAAQETPDYLRPAERPDLPAGPDAGFAPQSTAFDIPVRGADGIRPPYGNGSFGVHGFSPPGRRAEERMLSAESDSVAVRAFGKLADAHSGERSIDDLTRELLRPMLMQWLDQNLPPLVESIVREEIERIARRGGR